MNAYLEPIKKAAPVVAAAYVTQKVLASQNVFIQGAAMALAGGLAFKFISSKL